MALDKPPSVPSGRRALNESDALRRIIPISSTPYAKYLGATVAFTGTPEDAVLRAELKSFIATVIDEELHKLDTKIEVLTAYLRSAQEARAATQAFRDAHVAIFPPIHSLPPEIMTNIFNLVVGNGPVVLPARLTTAPWNLLTVCQYWRNIVQSLPYLWSSFDIKLGRGSPFLTQPPPMVHREDCALPLEVVKHLSLSRDEPLNFMFAASEVNLSHISLAELVKQSHRWKDVALSGRGDLYAALPGFRAARLKNLRSLSIQQISSRTAQDPITEKILQKFAKACCLTRLTLETRIASSSLTFSNPSAIAFPWSRLTYLKIISNVMPAFVPSAHPGCYHLLKACPRLHTFIECYALPLAWGVGDSAGFALPPGTPILNHQGRVLALIQPAVLSHLQCPNLQYLSLPPVTTQESASVIADFCRRSSCTELKKVDVKLTDTSSIYFAAILLALPFVETLTTNITSSRTMELCTCIINYITVTSGAVPRLQCLKLRVSDRAVWASNNEAYTKLVRYLARGVEKRAFRHVHIEVIGVKSARQSDIDKLASFRNALQNSTLSSSQLTIVNTMVEISSLETVAGFNW